MAGGNNVAVHRRRVFEGFGEILGHLEEQLVVVPGPVDEHGHVEESEGQPAEEFLVVNLEESLGEVEAKAIDSGKVGGIWCILFQHTRLRTSSKVAPSERPRQIMAAYDTIF